MKKWVIAIVSIAFFFFLLNTLNLVPHVSLLENQTSTKILSHDGTVLRQTLAQRGGRQTWISLEDVAPEFISLLIHTEDKRFYYHMGVDPFAIMRAILQSVKAKSIVSGASTIPMQLARMSTQGNRSLKNKIKEMGLALYLEMVFSKDELIEYYINYLPFGNELYGIKEAAWNYFNKSPKDLSLSESAYLLAIIRAPTFYNPYLRHSAILELKKNILTLYGLKKKGFSEAVTKAIREKVVLYPLKRNFLAPHFTDFVLNELKNQVPSQTNIRTSLDLALFDYVQYIVTEQLQSLEDKQVSQASVLVVRNETGEILTYLGSQNYWQDLYQGMNDGVWQKRQPGSALKPFMYAKALDVGVSPSHVLPDVRLRFVSEIGEYSPENYDRRYHGPVLMRTALANSLNVPAVKLLQEIGVAELYDTLKKMHFSSLTEPPSHYGLGLTLGNVEVSLFELVRAYSVFGRKGYYCDLTFQPTQHSCYDTNNDTIFSKESVFVIRDMLSDAKARILTFGREGPLDFDYPVMIKTGTSQNYRDNWTVAVTPEYTVGVWAGNFNGDPMQDVSGVTGAAPIAHKIVDFLYQKNPWGSWDDKITLKKEKVCSLSGKKPTKYCGYTRQEFVSKDNEPCDFHKKNHVNLPPVYAEWQQEHWPESLPKTQILQQKEGLRILSPENNAVYKIDLHRPKESQYLILTTSQPLSSFDVYLDDVLLSDEERENIGLSQGKHELKLVEGEHVLDRVIYYVR